MKSYKNRRLPLKPSTNDELLIFLISAELKCSKVVLVLGELGCSDGYYQPDFCPVVLRLAGFHRVTDALVGRYVRLVDKYAAKIMPDNESVMAQALKSCKELRQWRRADFRNSGLAVSEIHR